MKNTDKTEIKIEYQGLVTGGDDGVLAVMTGVLQEDPQKEIWCTLTRLRSLSEGDLTSDDAIVVGKAILDYETALANPTNLPVPPGGIPVQQNLFD